MNNPIPTRGKPGEEVYALMPIGRYNAQGWFVLYFTPRIPNRSNGGTGGPRRIVRTHMLEPNGQDLLGIEAKHETR